MDLIQATHVGKSGEAFVLGRPGVPSAARFKQLREVASAGGGETAEGNDAERRSVIERWRLSRGRIGWPLSLNPWPKP